MPKAGWHARRFQSSLICRNFIQRRQLHAGDHEPKDQHDLGRHTQHGHYREEPLGKQAAAEGQYTGKNGRHIMPER